MGYKLASLARMTTTTTGTGTITLGSAVSGFKSFAGAGISDGEVVSYAIEEGASREVGYGVYTASGTTLTRNVVASTNSDAAINLGGAAEVFISPLPFDLEVLDEDDFASNSALQAPSQQSTAAYIAAVAPFAKRASVIESSGVNILNNTLTLLSFGSEQYDTAGLFDTGTPSRFTIPAGVSAVQLYAYAQYTATITGIVYINIQHKNSGGTVLQTVLIPMAGGYYGGGATPTIECTAGDYFEMRLLHQAGSTRTTSGGSYFAIAAVA